MSEQPERIELSNRVEYRLNGKLHREDGPAVERSNGYKAWYINGKLHRLDGPAIDRPDGSKEWYVDGKLHRLDGPAIERPDGSKEWWFYGKRHRLDGPAVEWMGTQWYIYDKLCNKSDVDKFRLKTIGISFVVNRRIWKLFGTNYVKKVI